MAKTLNTLNLWFHLQIHHLESYETAQKKVNLNLKQGTVTSSQPKIHGMFQKQKKWPKSDERSKHIDKLITETIITETNHLLWSPIVALST